MKPGVVPCYIMPALAVCLLWRLNLSSGDEIQEEPEVNQDDFCLTEDFKPQCVKNEIILMKSATYGRMRIGRCITAAEIVNLRTPQLGCSDNLLPFLDKKCSGKADCEIRVSDISAGNVSPCPIGLNVYLEASYDCISTVDERRSCVVDATANPIHIISSTSCGSNSQPWIVEAPIGQKLSIGIIDLAASDRPTTSGVENNGRQSCRNRGFIVDKAGKRNVSICAGGTQREKKLYSSTGNLLNIFLTHQDQIGSNEDEARFMLRLQAVGCSNIIPPIDGYAKRNGDAIMIGCYASRKTWHLNCEDGKWVGVIGNCSQGVHAIEEVEEVKPVTTNLNNEQVLVFVAIGGFTFAVCLAIVCLGVVCMRRFRVKSKMTRDYKTLIPNCNFNSTTNQSIDNRATRNVAQEFSGNNVNGLVPPELPTYSVFVGDGEFNDVSNNTSVESNHR